MKPAVWGWGTGKYELQLKALAKQKQSQDILSRSITDLRKMRKVINWPEMKEFLAERWVSGKDCR